MDGAVGAFWDALVHQRASLNGDFVELPQGVFVLGRAALGSSFFVRECYKQLFDFFPNSKWNIHQRRTGIPWSSKWVVTGNPGVGKTYFAAYLMWRLAQQKATVVYEPPSQGDVKAPNSSKRYLLLPDGTVQVRAAGMEGFEDYLADPATWFIVDAHGANECAARVVILTSPRPSVYKEFLKVQDARKVFMPVWTLEELEACRAKLFSTLTAGRVKELFQVWGGIPRKVLQEGDPTEDDSRNTELTEALSKCNLSRLQDSVGEIANGDDVSHRLLHFHVEAPSFMAAGMRYASTHVALLVTDKILANQRSELVSYVTASNWLLPESAKRGYVFEGLAHAALRNGGKMRIRELGPRGEKVRSLRLPQLEAHCFEDVSQVDLKKNRYYYPLSKNLAVVDSITSAGLFQITVSPHHPIKAKQLETLIEQLRLTDLFFVVPSSLFNSFSAQPFHTKEDTILKRIPTALKSVKQWVLDLQL